MTSETVLPTSPDSRSDARPQDIPPGRVLFGQLEVIERFRSGGMGDVYRARHIGLGETRAIKVMRPDLASNPDVFELFKREAQALLQVSHPAVVRCHDLLSDDTGRLYLVMEFIEGETLAERVRERALSRGEVEVLARRILGGLEAAHAADVIHRDISPDNVLLPGGRLEHAKLIDFGIARLPSTQSVFEGFKGKFAYASPEQLYMYAEKIEPGSDLFSLGLVLATALHAYGGAPPRTLDEARERRLQPTALPSSLGQPLTELMLKLLVLDPKKRLPSAAAALALLDERSPRSRRSALIPLALCAAGALVIGLGSVLYWRGEEPLRKPPDPIEIPPETKDRDAPESPLSAVPSFREVRERLRDAAGESATLTPRIWVEPAPVGNHEPYVIHAEAQCRCSMLVFLIHGKRDQVDLIFPNRLDPLQSLETGSVFRVPSAAAVPAYELTAEDGPTTDLLKVVVTTNLPEPWSTIRDWSMSIDEPDRVRELDELLTRIDLTARTGKGTWAAAEAPLEILP